MSDEGFVERLDRLVAQDEIDAANEVHPYYTRDQAMDLKRILRWSLLEASNPYTKNRVPVSHERLSVLYDLITDAMRAKGMLDE